MSTRKGLRYIDIFNGVILMYIKETILKEQTIITTVCDICGKKGEPNSIIYKCYICGRDICHEHCWAVWEDLITGELDTGDYHGNICSICREIIKNEYHDKITTLKASKAALEEEEDRLIDEIHKDLKHRWRNSNGNNQS